MKDRIVFKLFLFLIFSIVLFGCTLNTNDVNPQTSKSIKESKANDLLIAEYEIEQRPAEMFEIKEAWQEKIWYNKATSFHTIAKDTSKGKSWILLKIGDKGRFNYANFHSQWELYRKETSTYSGYIGGVFEVSLGDKESPDSLKLTVIEHPHSSDRKECGEIIIRKK